MSDEQHHIKTELPAVESPAPVSPFRRFVVGHRLIVLIGGAVVAALALVTLSMTFYHVSGTSQLDLSRPGYEKVRDQAEDNKKTFTEYSATGSINEEALKEFRTLFEEQAKSAEVDAFGGDPMAPDALGIDERVVQE